MAKKVVLVSSGQPSLNPRLVKEADALADAGYQVTVLYAYWNQWATGFDQQLLPGKKWKAVCIGGDPVNKRGTYFLSRLLFKLAQTISRKTNGKLMADAAIARPALFLYREAKKYKADLYIGHNLAALPAVIAAAKANNAPCGFDAEDFHRYETSDNNLDFDVVLKTAVEDRYLPQLSYFSASSPQIAAAYQQLYPQLKPVVLLNVFTDDAQAVKDKPQSGPLKLFWFSQIIGANRGLQDAVAALQLLPKAHFELHVLGSQLHSEAFINELRESGIDIHFHNPVQPDDLTDFAARFDIGLALEPGFSVNNNIALSNKIFTYMQAGLAVVASDTAAQKYLLDENPDLGKLYPRGNAQALADLLAGFYQDRILLTAAQTGALNLARTKYNWQVESQKFLSAIKQTLAQHAS